MTEIHILLDNLTGQKLKYDTIGEPDYYITYKGSMKAFNALPVRYTVSDGSVGEAVLDTTNQKYTDAVSAMATAFDVTNGKYWGVDKNLSTKTASSETADNTKMCKTLRTLNQATKGGDHDSTESIQSMLAALKRYTNVVAM
jgi:hypothetical protein